jgi:hypothetical protein
MPGKAEQSPVVHEEMRSLSLRVQRCTRRDATRSILILNRQTRAGTYATAVCASCRCEVVDYQNWLGG